MDEVPHFFFDNAILFLRVMTHLVHLSFSTGIFPNLLKLTITIPVYKKIEKNLLEL